MPAPRRTATSARRGRVRAPGPVVAAGPGGGHVAVVAIIAGGLGGTNDAEGSGNALSASRSSFWNSRTDSSADSTAKETRLEASDCLRFFLAASLSRPAPLGDLPSTLLTSLKMLLLLRLRMEEGRRARDVLLRLRSGGRGRRLGGRRFGGGQHVLRVRVRGGGAAAVPGRAPAGQLGARHGRSMRESSPERPRWDQCAGGPASMSRPETCARRSPGFARVHAESRAPARLTLATPLRTAACASRNARVARSHDAWAFKSSRWTHRQLRLSSLIPPVD
jgi:hypothetical protein